MRGCEGLCGVFLGPVLDMYFVVIVVIMTWYFRCRDISSVMRTGEVGRSGAYVYECRYIPKPLGTFPPSEKSQYRSPMSQTVMTVRLAIFIRIMERPRAMGINGMFF